MCDGVGPACAAMTPLLTTAVQSMTGASGDPHLSYGYAINVR